MPILEKLVDPSLFSPFTYHMTSTDAGLLTIYLVIYAQRPDIGSIVGGVLGDVFGDEGEEPTLGEGLLGAVVPEDFEVCVDLFRDGTISSQDINNCF